MTTFPPDRARFNAFLSAAATRLVQDVRQDPNAAFDVDRDRMSIRGLVDIDDGHKVWFAWPLDWERMYRDAPEAVAYDFIEALKLVRREHTLVSAALSNPKYEWRTIDGVARETGLAPDDVRRIIVELADTVIQSTVPDSEGRTLFATRRHYRATHGAAARLGNIFRAG